MTKIKELQTVKNTLLAIANERAVDYLFRAINIDNQIKSVENEIFAQKILELCRTGK